MSDITDSQRARATPLRSITDAPVAEHVVSVLRHLLACAERGELQGIYGVALKRGDETLTFRSSVLPVTALGALRVLEHKLIQEMELNGLTTEETTP